MASVVVGVGDGSFVRLYVIVGTGQRFLSAINVQRSFKHFLPTILHVPISDAVCKLGVSATE